MCFSTVACAQSSKFVGTWQTRKSSVTGSPNITVKIAEEENALSGSVILVNPDRTTMNLPIVNPSLSDEAFSFQTIDGEDTMHWSLAVDKTQKKGVLKGSIHEMLIDAKVTKAR